MPERAFPDSSVLVSATHDAATNVLRVELRSGRVYDYFLVPASVYAELCAAESAGNYYNRVVRNGFSHREVTD